MGQREEKILTFRLFKVVSVKLMIVSLNYSLLDKDFVTN